MTRLAGKTAFITGGSRGVGRAIAVEFAREGANVAITYVSNAEAAKEVVVEIESFGRRGLALKADVAVRNEVEQLIEYINAKLGPIDILVNNAGITRPAMLWKMTDEQWNAVVDVHLKGSFHCIQAVSKIMMERKCGKIINVTSTAGLVGTIGQLNYSAAKGGVIAMTKSAARELAGKRINVNCISLGVVETDMTRKLQEDSKLREIYEERILLGRFAKTDDVVPVFLFLASGDSDYMTGQVLNVDGGTVL
ncbi:SDR family NAD(P)-dependent oxidoreductase [Desulfatiglans anilini]|uniref:SDR family NAD(P)-dependent oxidoreductase n=1 Tax=Desulfatiglans anilini TaxID=90728 RepID=UPI000419D187|nr:3-oxoacyl-ACP reductase family protein [Desulfatiglans anilini]